MKRSVSAAGSVFVLAMLFSALAVKVVHNTLLRQNENELINTAELQVAALSSRVHSDLNHIGSAANYVSSSSGYETNLQGFTHFARNISVNNKSVISYQWMQKVTPEELPEHIAAMKRKFAQYTLYTVPKNMGRVDGYIYSTPTPIYVMSDVYPREPENLELLGFYSSRERFRLILEDVKTSGKANVSDPVRLLQDGGGLDAPKQGILVYHPVFNQEGDDLLGIMVGVIRMTAYFEDIVSETSAQQPIMVRIRDTGFNTDDWDLLYQSDNWQQQSSFAISHTISLQNRDWVVEFHADLGLTDNDRWILGYIMFAGLSMSLLLTWMAWFIAKQKLVLQAKLDESTKELQFLVAQDVLTTLFNRRAFNYDLNQLIATAEPFSLISIDVDNFKQINDQHGHPVGDAFLVHVAKLLLTCVADDDKVYRLGGDEFVIISNESSIAALEHLLQRILDRAKQQPLLVEQERVSVSLSLGGVIWQGYQYEELLQLADKMLYQSKRAGKGRFCIA